MDDQRSRPSHPMAQMVLLLVIVTLLIVVLAISSL